MLSKVLVIGTVLGLTFPPLIQTFVEAPGPHGPLKGTMLAPTASHAPVVLIIPGSGPTDRDGNGDVGLRASTYRYLAEGLVADGIASVRIDKRGMYGSRGAGDGNVAALADYTRDLIAWIATIRAQTGTSCVWLLGHSEGGLVALASAKKIDALCGLILVATPGRRLGDILREQLHANPANAPLLDQALSILDRLEKGQPVPASEIGSELMPLFRPQVQPFLIDVFARDPAALVANVGVPILILQGDHDLQVSVEDATRLAKAAPQAELVILPAVNHVLKQVAKQDRMANFLSYTDPSLPLAPDVVPAITAFIRARTPH